MSSRHPHDHGAGRGLWERLRHLLVPHSHDTADVVDGALEASRKGMRALWLSVAALTVTAIGQAVLVGFTGSVALLSDTLHNFAGALTAVPLALAFWLGRRAATRRFAYGLGRAEDLAGLLILVVIAASAGLAAWEAVGRLLSPRSLDNLGWLAAAGLFGFVGNELVGRYRIRVGRQIGSAALVADGLHARTDGFTSLAVLFSALGGVLGWQWVDPIVGLVITVAIVVVLVGAGREVFGRLLDAVDPALVDRAEQALGRTPGVLGVDLVRLRWVGHTLYAEADLTIGSGLTLAEAHRLAHDAEGRLAQALPRLARASIHAHPADSHRDGALPRSIAA
ncbi:MAG TPA: cation diffusion facilitator family transporter [Actinopolymorphaceae bacterium]